MEFSTSQVWWINLQNSRIYVYLPGTFTCQGRSDSFPFSLRCLGAHSQSMIRPTSAVLIYKRCNACVYAHWLRTSSTRTTSKHVVIKGQEGTQSFLRDYFLRSRSTLSGILRGFFLNAYQNTSSTSFVASCMLEAESHCTTSCHAKYFIQLRCRSTERLWMEVRYL